MFNQKLKGILFKILKMTSTNLICWSKVLKYHQQVKINTHFGEMKCFISSHINDIILYIRSFADKLSVYSV